LPVLTYVSSLEIELEKPMKLRVKRLTEEGYQELIVTPPCVITVVKEIASPRLPTLRGKKRAREAKVLSWGAESLGLKKGEVGLLVSPTRVAKVFYPKITRNGARIVAHNDTAIEHAISCIISRLESEGVFDTLQEGPRAHLDYHISSNVVVVEPLVLRAEESKKPEFWILTEFRNQTIDVVSFELLARARALADCRGARLIAIVLAQNCGKSETSALIGHGADSVVLVESPEFEHFICEPWAAALASLARARKPEVFLSRLECDREKMPPIRCATMALLVSLQR
jgi:electron transfer flavoprotein alpha/beta subunit